MLGVSGAGQCISMKVVSPDELVCLPCVIAFALRSCSTGAAGISCLERINDSEFGASEREHIVHTNTQEVHHNVDATQGWLDSVAMNFVDTNTPSSQAGKLDCKSSPRSHLHDVERRRLLQV